MNQIIYNLKNNQSNNSNIKTKKALYITIFLLFIIMVICFTTIYFFKQYIKEQNEIVSQNLANNFKISTLYSNSTNYDTSTTSTNSNTFVIGILKIDKIKLDRKSVV